ncbi:tRNA (cytosine34-C5)-methyltransferase [Nematocida sp. AWRm80]|nr:tRNA (cytosine34-C5)-methyltransferase [Nematocida sp. AWRm80]
MIRETVEEKTTRSEEGYRRVLEYYTGIFEDAEECISTLLQPLPTVFRITPTNLSSILKEEIKKHKLITALPWSSSIFQIPLTRKELSARGVKENKGQLDEEELQKTHRFLRMHSETALLTRQEAVSMIPVEALEIQRDSKVLDMCASPGSKSSQILETLSSDGILICNDVNTRRIDQLVKQTRRFGHPGLIITCNDATMYPKPAISLDRILCDVPCSGDGTIRKNAHILQKWHTREALHLFSVQKRIVKRGIDMLSDNGILVYSTCSLNPIENEAVLMALLAERPNIEIVPFSIEGIKMRNGLSLDKVQLAIDKTDPDHKILTNTTLQYTDQIQNARRILPNDQNTGGFFVAKLRKLPNPNTNPLSNTQAQPNHLEYPIKPISHSNPAHIHIPDTENQLLVRGETNIEESFFYHLENQRKQVIEQQWGSIPFTLLSKSTGYKTLYGLSSQALSILQKSTSALRIVYAGVRMFCVFGRHSPEDITQDRWRPTTEGLSHLSPPQTKQIPISLTDMLSLLQSSTDNTPKLLSEYKKGIYILTSKIDHITIQAPIIINASGIEILIEKIQKQALANILFTLLSQQISLPQIQQII